MNKALISSSLIRASKITKPLSQCKPIALFSELKQQTDLSQLKQSSKLDVLKTYLQVIPPHQIHQLIQKKERKLQNLIKSAQSIVNSRTQQSMKEQVYDPTTQNKVERNLQVVSVQQEHMVFKEIYKYIKKKSPYVPTQTLSKIVEVCSSPTVVTGQTAKDIQVYKRKTYLKILRQFKYKSQALPLEQVIDFVYKLAKLNLRQYDVMKAAQNVIIQEKIKVNFPVIKKILWAFTHLDVGSSVLYSHISKTIKIGQHQLQPLQLAQCAYMLSKVSQNAKGGYGIFQIAEKHIEMNLSRMTFNELAKASAFLLTQNIGTNQFQLRLEAEIYKKYPSKDKLSLTDLVMLLKATSAYYFKFNDKALFNMLKTSTLREAKNATLEQFEDIVWSWGRLGKGDEELWTCLQGQVQRRSQFLKPRQTAFFYHALSSSSHPNPSTLNLLQQKFLTSITQTTNQHYFIKMLMGMQKQKHYNTSAFLTISSQICQRISNLSKNQLLAFFKVLNDSDYDYQNKAQISSIVEALNKAGTQKLLKTIFTLKVSEITQVLYTYIKLDIPNAQLIKQCFATLSEVINIPKQSFAKALFCFTIKDNYEKAYKMVVILEELLQYGPIGYFFSPYEFPLIGYCVLHLHYNSKGALEMDQEFIGQVKATMKQINPVILNDFVRKAYDEALNIIQKNKKSGGTHKGSQHKRKDSTQ